MLSHPPLHPPPPTPKKERRAPGERGRKMAAEKTSKLSEAYPMKAGDGPNSYAKNSAYQVVL